MRWSAARVWGRRHRARVDDAAMMTLGLLAGGLEVLSHLVDGLTPTVWWHLGLSVAMSVGLWWRRARPLLVTVAAAAVVSAGASIVLLPIVLLTLAVRRRGRVLALGIVVCEIAYVVTPGTNSSDAWLSRVEGLLLGSALVLGLPAATGAYVSARRALVASLRERADRAESDQVARAEQARAAERTRIAREMHDVLGHRISLVALHAGALEIHPNVSAAQVERTAGLIRTTSHQAMQELRGVLGVLRDAPDDAPDLGRPSAPQPTLTDVASLVHEHTEAGMTVTLHSGLGSEGEPPALVGRTAYRVVQESLTNAARHAPGAAVTVQTAGSPESGLEVEVSNTRGRRPAPGFAVTGSGLGLVGLRERVELAGGQLDAGPSTDGGFTLRAWLPWTAAVLPERPDDQSYERTVAR